MIAKTGATISGTPNPIDINQPFVPIRNITRRTLAMMATRRRCSRQFVTSLSPFLTSRILAPA